MLSICGLWPSTKGNWKATEMCCCWIFVIAIVNSRFLQRPEKRRYGNQLIHRHLIKTKSVGRRSSFREWVDSKRAKVIGVEMPWELGQEEDRIWYEKLQSFQFEWKICGELARGEEVLVNSSDGSDNYVLCCLDSWVVPFLWLVQQRGIGFPQTWGTS